MDGKQMDGRQSAAYTKLNECLSGLTDLYRRLLDIVKLEREALLQADIEKVSSVTIEKEKILSSILEVDQERQIRAKQLGESFDLAQPAPRLLELARVVPGIEGEKLKSIHAGLELIVKSVTEQNKENEIFAQSALANLNGALENIKQTLSGKKTYARKGKLSAGPEQAGNFVRKEA